MLDLLAPEVANSLDDRLAKLLSQVPLDWRDLHYETISAIATEIETVLRSTPQTSNWTRHFLTSPSH